jgi:hypothetical protein
MHKCLHIHFHKRSTNTTCFDLLRSCSGTLTSNKDIQNTHELSDRLEFFSPDFYTKKLYSIWLLTCISYMLVWGGTPWGRFKSSKHVVIVYCMWNCTGCPTRYRTRHFFNNSNTNEDIATKFEPEYVHCRHISYTMRQVRFKIAAISSLVVKLLKKCRVR